MFPPGTSVMFICSTGEPVLAQAVRHSEHGDAYCRITYDHDGKTVLHDHGSVWRLSLPHAPSPPRMYGGGAVPHGGGGGPSLGDRPPRGGGGPSSLGWGTTSGGGVCEIVLYCIAEDLFRVAAATVHHLKKRSQPCAPENPNPQWKCMRRTPPKPLNQNTRPLRLSVVSAGRQLPPPPPHRVQEPPCARTAPWFRGRIFHITFFHGFGGCGTAIQVCRTIFESVKHS